MAPRAPRTIATPAALPLDIEQDCQFRCSVRKGDIRDNPRGGKIVDFKSKISEGLQVAKAKVLSFVRRTMPAAQLISHDFYFKQSKGASQSQYVVLTEDNFEEFTLSRWNKISSLDVAKWTGEGMTPLEGFFFELFVYIHRRAVASVPTGLRRATASRVAASARQIREFEQENDVTIGPITRQHVAVRQARQPDGEAFAMPRDNTTRQAEFLDERRRIQQAEREAGREDEADRNRKKNSARS